jgi:hypothetical protein
MLLLIWLIMLSSSVSSPRWTVLLSESEKKPLWYGYIQNSLLYQDLPSRKGIQLETE